MPRIAELKEIDGAVWARVEMDMGSPIELLSPNEIEANSNREQRHLDEIERLREALKAIDNLNPYDDVAEAVIIAHEALKDNRIS